MNLSQSQRGTLPSGMGYATTSAALADDVNATVEQQNGISIGLHDYNRSSINNNHALHFMSGRNETGYNRYVQDGKGAYAGIVKPLLTNDYPTMADGNGSLDYLFGGAFDNAVTNYMPEGGLLTPDGQGNYSFDAASIKPSTIHCTYSEIVCKPCMTYKNPVNITAIANDSN